MAITSIQCPVLGAQVTQITDFEGRTTHITCPEYDASTDTCRLRKTASEDSPLARLLERTAEHSLDTRSTRCVLRAA